MEFTNFTHPKIRNFILKGKVGVLPTDTIYGIHASAFVKSAFEKIYKIKNRDLDKPFIVLISSLSDLEKLGVTLSVKENKLLQNIWPNKISILLNQPDKNFDFLNKGTQKIAIRMPNYPVLLELIKQTGPLVSTSANLQNKPSAKSIKEVKQYFGEKIDFYVDRGILENSASTLVEITNKKFKIIRQGDYKLKPEDCII